LVRERPSSNDRRTAIDYLLRIVKRSGELLPMPRPITAVGFCNILQALEDIPCDDGMQMGACRTLNWLMVPSTSSGMMDPSSSAYTGWPTII
jgi:hypothetical protein